MNIPYVVGKTTRRIASLCLAALGFITLTSTSTQAAVRGLYVGNEFYPPDAATETKAKQSGFNTLFLFTLNIMSNGDVQYNGTLIATNGTYVGNSTWGSRLAAIKNDGRINRIELCIGSWGSTAFDAIRDLVASQGTGSSSILYRNFLAIKNATGIDAIQYDDEGTYHASSATAFGQMLIGMGLKVTLCPYNWNSRTFWQSVKSGLGANCDAIYLQCYDGGAGNNPADWNTLFGGFKVYPGLWGNTTTWKDCITRFRDWRQNLGITGGFMWLNGTLQWDAMTWGYNLQIALEPVPFFMFANQATGKCIDLIGGDGTNGAPIRQWSYDYGSYNQHWAIFPTENNDHYKILSQVSGKALCVQNDSLSDGAVMHSYEYTGNNPGQQWDLISAGNGWYKIRNVKSGKILDIDAGNTANNAILQQWTDLNGTNQKFRLQPWGDYFIRAAGGRYICVQGMGSTNGSPIIQYDWQNNPWFKWRFENVGDGNYKLSSLNALGRVLCVVGGSSTAAANTHLWDYNTANAGDQKIRIRPLTNGKFKFDWVHDNMTWDIPGGATGNNVNLQQYPDNGFNWQQFSLERVQ